VDCGARCKLIVDWMNACSWAVVICLDCSKRWSWRLHSMSSMIRTWWSLQH
jgi:hypothetical protein